MNMSNPYPTIAKSAPLEEHAHNDGRMCFQANVQWATHGDTVWMHTNDNYLDVCHREEHEDQRQRSISNPFAHSQVGPDGHDDDEKRENVRYSAVKSQRDRLVIPLLQAYAALLADLSND